MFVWYITSIITYFILTLPSGLGLEKYGTCIVFIQIFHIGYTNKYPPKWTLSMFIWADVGLLFLTYSGSVVVQLSLCSPFILTMIEGPQTNSTKCLNKKEIAKSNAAAVSIFSAQTLPGIFKSDVLALGFHSPLRFYTTVESALS